MAHRFYFDAPLDEESATLCGDQAHHAINVMRLTTGDVITLFDGRGSEYVCEISGTSKKALHLRVVAKSRQSNLTDRSTTIAVALPKGDRQKFLIEKLVELNVDRFVPLKTARCISKVNDSTRQRLQKQVIEASKQCERSLLMSIEPEQSIAEMIANFPAASPLIPHDHPRDAAPVAEQNRANSEQQTASVHAVQYCCWVGDPDVDARLTEKLQSHLGSQHHIIAIGPEGGFTPEEIIQLREANWTPVRCNPNVLRIETAAIAAAVLLNASPAKQSEEA